ncbi:hypothetical protein HK405_007737 [Cladochytrium tenue]|nr:hypothetical protein HK405_007737 [Cladochytrium tenue]
MVAQADEYGKLQLTGARQRMILAGIEVVLNNNRYISEMVSIAREQHRCRVEDLVDKRGLRDVALLDSGRDDDDINPRWFGEFMTAEQTEVFLAGWLRRCEVRRTWKMIVGDERLFQAHIASSDLFFAAREEDEGAFRKFVASIKEVEE